MRRPMPPAIDELHTPAQGGCMNRCVPEALQLLIKKRHRRRTSGHVERCDEIANERSRNDSAGRLE
jgi:hypothetical protein